MMSEDLDSKVLDVDSTFRNRINYPNPFDFVIPYSFPNKGSTTLDFIDPVLESSPYTGSLTLQSGQLVTEGVFFQSNNVSLFETGALKSNEISLFETGALKSNEISLFETGALKSNNCIGGQLSSTTIDIILDSNDSSIDNFYINSSLQIGNQFRQILSYNGTTKVCRVDLPFSIAPPPGTVYYTRKQKIYFNSNISIYKINHTFGTVNQLLLLTASPSPIKNFYRGSYIRFTNGPHESTTALITAYEPFSKVDVWNQELTNGNNTFLKNEGGFLFKPNVSGILYIINLNLICFTTLTYRNLLVKVYNGTGLNGSLLYYNTFNIYNTPSKTDYQLIISGGPSLISGSNYTISIQDTTIGINNGYINIFGIVPTKTYNTFNLSTYPKTSVEVISMINDTVWTQNTALGANDYIPSSLECGFVINPINTGIITKITTTLISFDSILSSRTITLKIRDNNGLSGSIIFQNDYNITNTILSPVDIDISIVGGPLLTTGNTYTLTLEDVSPGGVSTGYLNLFGIIPDISNVSYNINVYPRLIIEYNNYYQTNILSYPFALSDKQGSSSALSSDGSTLVVGAPANTPGKTFIWKRSGLSWTLQTTLIGTGSISLSQQGSSVSVSSDGTVVAIGAPSDNISVGATWVFMSISGIWVQQAKLIGTGGTNAFQGSSVSLSGDGNTLAIGGPGDTTIGTTGAIWIFRNIGGVWTEQSKLYDSLNDDLQGGSVSLSYDGNTLCYGCHFITNSFIRGSGGVWNFSGGVWNNEGILTSTGGDPGSICLGWSCSISGDGNTAVLGAIKDVEGGLKTGAVYVYTRTAGVWTQSQRILGTPSNDNALIGSSCSLSGGDSSTLIFCGVGDNSNIGSLYIYKKTGGIWSLFSEIIPTSSSSSSQFGTSCCISNDTTYITVGAPTDTSNKGGSWIFNIVPSYSQLSNPVVTSLLSTSESGFKFTPSLSGIASKYLANNSSVLLKAQLQNSRFTGVP